MSSKTVKRNWVSMIQVQSDLGKRLVCLTSDGHLWEFHKDKYVWYSECLCNLDEEIEKQAERHQANFRYLVNE